MSSLLKIRQLVTILLCNTIGAAIFALPSIVLILCDSVLYSLLAWLVAAIIAIGFGLCYAELGSMFPQEGGDAIYLSEAYGKYFGVAFSVISILTILPMGASVMVNTICQAIGITRINMKLIFLGIICTIAFINYMGNDFVYKTQYFLTVLKMMVVLFFLVFAACVFFNLIETKEAPQIVLKIEDAKFEPMNFFKAVTLILWAFDGYNTGNFIAHNVHNPTKTLFYSPLVSTTLVAIIYIFLNVTFFYVLPLDVMKQNTLIRSFFDNLKISTPAKNLARWSVYVIPPLGTLNGSFLVAVSIFESYIQNHPHRRLVRTSGILVFVMIIFGYTFIENISDIIANISFIAYCFYGASVGSIFILRRKKNAKQGYRVPNAIGVFCLTFSILMSFYFAYKTYKKIFN